MGKSFSKSLSKNRINRKVLEKAILSFDQTTMQPVIELEFDAEGQSCLNKLLKGISEKHWLYI
jgi:preprotein translocase subunit SecD